MRAPEFWEHGKGLLPRLLSPASGIYRMGAAARHVYVRSRGAGVPVVCVGNLVAGGAGKTPIASAVALELIERGLGLHFLTRGYGGTERGPLAVEIGRHDHRVVGDEALLLAEIAPTWVGRDRLASARAAVGAGAELLVMDDGYQDPSLVKNLSLLVIDGSYGFGNGRLIPAGPLREPVASGLTRADAVVLVGEDRAGIAAALPGSLPILRARLAPAASAERLRGRQVIAFAGIGRPAKFFETLRDLGSDLVQTIAFADHHRYRPDEIMAICERASRAGAVPVTTRKDSVRLPLAARAMVEVVDIVVEWADAAMLDRILLPVIEQVGNRRRLRRGDLA